VRSTSRNGSKPTLAAYTLTLELTDLKERNRVWEAELLNSDVRDDAEKDKIKMKTLVTEHFIQAGIIPPAIITATVNQ